MTDHDARGVLRRAYQAGVDAVRPENCLPHHLEAISRDQRLHLLAAGKAAEAMAAVAVEAFGPDLPGLVVTRYGHRDTSMNLPSQLHVIEAGHPVPDERSLIAAEAALELAQGLGPDDHLLFLVSGGGSAVLAAPCEEISIADAQATSRALLMSGAPISDINCIRKHLSRIKGGRLAVAAAPAKVTTLAISDVIDDDPSLVASGPTLPDDTSLEEARAIIEHYGMKVPDAVHRALNNMENETPDPSHPAFANNDDELIASNRHALEAAKSVVEDAGYEPMVLGDDIAGEARDVGRAHAALALEVMEEGRRCAILSGGECTVSLKNMKGSGGPNLEYLTGLALELKGAAGITALAADTDGIDGSADHAGGYVTPDTVTRAEALGYSLEGALEDNDTYPAFQALGDLLVTGPTLTNVNDLRVILVDPS